jgi:hypothetical protein
MHRNRVLKRFSMVVLVAFAMTMVATVGFAKPIKIDDGNPRVLPSGSNPYGMSYAEWSVKWWQWAYSLPVTGHPLFDETGADCAAGQSGPVWFLGGVFNVSGTAHRTLCKVPSGTALFFPIINAEWDNFCPPGNLTLDELRATVAGFMDLVTDLVCEVDGTSIVNLQSYRFAGDPFGVEMPSDNIWDAFGCPTSPGLYEPLVPDGFFLMLAPLSVGQHAIHFRGTIGDPVNFTLDITYDLTVVPNRHVMIAGDAPGDQGTGVDTTQPTSTMTWGRIKTIYR